MLLDGERKAVSILLIILLFVSLGLGIFNIIGTYKLAQLVGVDVGVLRGENNIVNTRISELEEGVGLSHTALKSIIIKVDEQDNVLDYQSKKISELNKLLIKAEKNYDKLNARVQQIEYNKVWEARKNVWTNRANLIRQGIWKGNQSLNY